jgi:hypothetical protein
LLEKSIIYLFGQDEDNSFSTRKILSWKMHIVEAASSVQGRRTRQGKKVAIDASKWINDTFEQLVKSVKVEYWLQLHRLVLDAISIECKLPLKIVVVDIENDDSETMQEQCLLTLLSRSLTACKKVGFLRDFFGDIQACLLADIIVVEDINTLTSLNVMDLLTLCLETHTLKTLILTDAAIFRLVPTTVMEHVLFIRPEAPDTTWKYCQLLKQVSLIPLIRGLDHEDWALCVFAFASASFVFDQRLGRL